MQSEGMHPERRRFAWINVLGGTAVLGSYAIGIAGHPNPGDALWGNVPEGLRPLYTASMLTAATGYFLFAYRLFFRVDPERARLPGGRGFGTFNVLLLAILVPSALWMPLTFAYLAAPGVGLWLAVRGVLAVTGLASLALIAALWRLEPQGAPLVRLLSVAGAAAFAFQTAVLDAVVWPAFF